MRNPTRILIASLSLLPLAPLVGGCSNYVLTAPDQLGPAGGEAVAIVRLQRREAWLVSLPVKQALMSFQADGQQQRGAYTDDSGYAGTTVPLPDRPGRYDMSVCHTDREGDLICTSVPAYAWDPNALAAAVDLDHLPKEGSDQASAAAATLSELGERANLVYFTRRPIREHREIHEELVRRGCPDGPVLPWEREYWHLSEGGWRVVVESRLVGQLPDLCRMLPRLKLGVAASELAVKAFTEAGLVCAVVGDVDDIPHTAFRYDSWGELDTGGLFR